MRHLGRNAVAALAVCLLAGPALAAAKAKLKTPPGKVVPRAVPSPAPTPAPEPEPTAAPAPVPTPAPVVRTGPEPERPWAKGVPPAKQEKALSLFRDGNAALKESLFLKAAQLYREALQSWDHPAIHYNLALVLVNLDQPLETHQNLLAALKYGASPLDSDKFEQAQRYKALVEKQLAKVEIRCALEGAMVKLDGVELFVGPGHYEGLVRAGLHTIIATHEGYLTNEQSEALAGSSSRVFDLKLLTPDDLTEYRRRWDSFVPWTFVAAGVVVAGGGVGLHLAAKNAFRVYDSEIAGCSVGSTTNGCVPGLDVAATRSRGDTYQALAITAYAVGGAALATGAVLLYLNRLQPYRTTVGVTPQVSVVPLLGPNPGATLLVTF